MDSVSYRASVSSSAIRMMLPACCSVKSMLLTCTPATPERSSCTSTCKVVPVMLAFTVGALRSMTATRVLSSNVCPCGSVMRKVNVPFSCTAISALPLSNSCSQSVQSPSFIRYAIWYQPRFCSSFTLTVMMALLLRFQPPGAVSTIRYGAHSSCVGALSARARCRLAASSISRQRMAVHCFHFRFIHFLLRAIGRQRGFQGDCPACRISFGGTPRAFPVSAHTARRWH